MPAVNRAEAATDRPQVRKSDDRNLLVLVAEIVDTKACQRLRNTYRGLAGLQDPAVMGGTLWIRECSIENDGTNITARLSGDGWEWVNKQQEKAEAKFAVQQYVKFHVAATVRGTLDASYGPRSKIVTIWFAPTGHPAVQFQPIGNVSVDEQGLWSSIVGTASSVVSETPNQKATEQVQKQGAQSFTSKLDKGLTITLNACTGQSHTAFGQVPEAQAEKQSAAKPSSTPVALNEGGLAMFGPETGSKMNIVVDVTSGTVHVDAVCRAQADAIAQAFVRGTQLPAVKTLASADITGNGQLPVKGADCPVVVIARPRTPRATFSWKRDPPASSTPLVECAKRSARNRTTNTRSHATRR
ncbi:MAG: hypothetical protein JWO36_4537 [Myxococcales bacterium]|nr:hypothetical protein [Myxococcales bacterium]